MRAAASLVSQLAAAGGCALLLPGERRPLTIERTSAAWPRAHARLALVGTGGRPRRRSTARRRARAGAATSRRGRSTPPARGLPCAARRAALAARRARARSRAGAPVVRRRRLPRLRAARGAGGRAERAGAAAAAAPRRGPPLARGAAARAVRGSAAARGPSGRSRAGRAWSSPRRPGGCSRVLAPRALGVALALVNAPAAPPRRPAAARSPPALVALGSRCVVLLAAGPGAARARPAQLGLSCRRHRRRASGRCRGVAVPYHGADAWVRATIMLGGGALLLAIAAALVALLAAAAAPRAAPAPRCRSSSSAVPAVLIERRDGAASRARALRRAGARPAGSRASRARPTPARWPSAPPPGCSRALAAAGRSTARHALAGLRAPRPTSLGAQADARFDWTHRYGPLDWPRTGREVLRVKMKRPVYMKAENLDGVRRPALAHRGRASPASAARTELPYPPRRADAETLRITLRSMSSWPVIGAGAIVGVSRLPTGARCRRAARAPSRASSRLAPGDSYKVRVYAPTPADDEPAPPPAARIPSGSDAYRTLELPRRHGPPARRRSSPRSRLPAWPRPLVLDARGRCAALRSRCATPAVRPRLRARPPPGPAGSRRPRTTRCACGATCSATGSATASRSPRRALPLMNFLFHRPLGLLPALPGAMALLAADGRGAGPRGHRLHARRPRRQPRRVRGPRPGRPLLGRGWFPRHGWVPFDPTPPRLRAALAGRRRRGPHVGRCARHAGVRRGDRRRGRARARPRRGALRPGAGWPRRCAGRAAAARRAHVAIGAAAAADPGVEELERALRARAARPRRGRPCASWSAASRQPDGAPPTCAPCARRATAAGAAGPTPGPARAPCAASSRAASAPGGRLRALVGASAARAVRAVGPDVPRLERWTTSTSSSSAGTACSSRATTTPPPCPCAGARELEPDKTSIREALGRACFPRTATARPRQEFEAVVERAPTNDYALFCLGRSLQKLGRHAEATRPLNLAAGLRPDRGDYRTYRDRSRRRAAYGPRVRGTFGSLSEHKATLRLRRHRPFPTRSAATTRRSPAAPASRRARAARGSGRARPGVTALSGRSPWIHDLAGARVGEAHERDLAVPAQQVVRVERPRLGDRGLGAQQPVAERHADVQRPAGRVDRDAPLGVRRPGGSRRRARRRTRR